MADLESKPAVDSSHAAERIRAIANGLAGNGLHGTADELDRELDGLLVALRQAEAARDERDAGAQWQYEMGKKWKERAEAAEEQLARAEAERDAAVFNFENLALEYGRLETALREALEELELVPAPVTATTMGAAERKVIGAIRILRAALSGSQDTGEADSDE